MAHIELPDGLPGIRGLLTQVRRRPNPWASWPRCSCAVQAH